MQKNEIRPLSYTIHKNILKMDKRPECETGNHQNPRGESRKNLFDFNHSNFLLNPSPKAGELKEKMNYWDLMKIKNFTAKETINKIKRQPMEWEQIFFLQMRSNKGLLFKIYKKLTKLYSQKTNNPVKKWAEDMIRHFSKEHIKMVNRHMKRSQRHSSSGKYKSKPHSRTTSH